MTDVYQELANRWGMQRAEAKEFALRTIYNLTDATEAQRDDIREVTKRLVPVTPERRAEILSSMDPFVFPDDVDSGVLTITTDLRGLVFIEDDGTVRPATSRDI